MNWRDKKISTLFCLILLAIVCVFLLNKLNRNNHDSVTFFDVGQGDATLITFNNGEKMLVDCGINKKILSKLGSALSFFDRTIDYLVVTHPDGDHYGGCPEVLKRYQIKNIITNGVLKNNDPFWVAWKKYQNLENANNKIIDSKEIIKIGSSTITFLAPDKNFNVDFVKAGGNNSSIVFLLENKLGKFLFTGDMEVLLEQEIINNYCSDNFTCSFLKADYLKVGHHGSDSSSGMDFLSKVDAKYAIISVGQNKYGHPSLRTLRKLQRAGSEIWRTDQLNDIIVK